MTNPNRTIASTSIMHSPKTNGSPVPSTLWIVFSRIRHCGVSLLSFSRRISGLTLIDTVTLSAIVAPGEESSFCTYTRFQNYSLLFKSNKY